MSARNSQEIVDVGADIDVGSTYNPAVRKSVRAARLTGREEHDGLEAGVLCRVDLQRLQLLHLLLEDADVVHEGHHALRRHGRRVQAGRRQQGRHVERHGALGGVEDEELAPRHAQQRHLECTGCQG